jgi:23S rRNA (guanine745-N1)-methyltransferase
MPRSCLACTVRSCGLPLARRERTFACAAGHSYDVARSGYVNLLQPQDRRSSTPGDSTAVVEARSSLLAAGVGRLIVDRFVDRAAELELDEGPTVVELGSGSGDVIGEFARKRSIVGIGIDISRAAAAHAARRFPEVTWVVTNADRRLPLLDRSVDLILSLHGRRNPDECARSLIPSGFLLVAVPAEDDLVELRALVQGAEITRDRREPLLAAHQPSFRLVEQLTVRTRQHLPRESLLSLLLVTYRGGRATASARAKTLTMLEVTLASHIFLFSPR